jgi:hypothetical protein
MFKFPGDQESHLGQLAGEKSEPADQFSPKESFASSPLDLAFAAVASKLQTLRPAPSPQVTPLSKQDAELIAEAFLDLAAQKGATNKFHCEDLAIKVPRSPAAEASTLVQKVLHLEKQIDDLCAWVNDFGASLRIQLTEASLRSVKQAVEHLNASRPQVYRWTNSGELKATWLDSHPRYRPNDLKAFIDSRAARGKPIQQAKKTDKAMTPKRGARSTSRTKSHPGRSKSKNIKKMLL